MIETSILDAYEMLEDGKPVEIVPLPIPSSEPEDEQTPEFLSALEEAKRSDDVFLAELAKLGKDSSARAKLKVEAALRDRVREALGMSPITREKLVSREEQAERLGIDPSFDLEDDSGGKQRRRGKPRGFRILLYPEEAERRLSALFEQARLSESETGINTLFAAFGFLEWYESASSDEAIFSPVLLFPIQISREIREDQYVYSISSRGEDLSENICLLERLKRDFGIKPEPLSEEETPAAYFERLARLISERSNWRIHKNLTIGFFSFAKLAMYHDLEPDGINPGPDDVLTKLLDGDEASSIQFAEDYEVDQPRLREKLQSIITDADSSQLSAVIDVVDGENLVIEGPPGTGKSQTITNIIASALAQGKKVLFVAEKRAALEVVKKRLDEAGLGLFCLELHSNKTRKTDVLKSLGDRLQRRAGRARARRLSELLEQQETIRSEMASYLRAVNSPFGQLEGTVHSCIWKYLRLSKELHDLVPRSLFSISVEGCDSITEAGIEANRSALRSLEKHLAANLAAHPAVVTHPWFGLARHDHSPDDSERLLVECGSSIAAIQVASEAVARIPIMGSLLKECALDEILADLPRITAARSLLDRHPFSELIPRIGSQAEIQLVRAGIDSARDLWDCEKWLKEMSGRVQLECNPAQLNSLAEAARYRGLGECTCAAAEEVERTASGDVKSIQESSEFCTELAARCGLPDVPRIEEAQYLFQAVKQASAATPEIRAHRGPQTLEEGSSKSLLAIGEVIARLRSVRDELAAVIRIETDVPSAALLEAVLFFRQTGILRYLMPAYWRYRRLYVSLAMDGKPGTPTEMARRLELLVRFRENVAKFENNSSFRSRLADHYNGIETEVGPLVAASIWAEGIRAALPGFSGTALKLRELLFQGAPSVLELLAAMGLHPRFELERGKVLGLSETGDFSAALQRRREHVRGIRECIDGLKALRLPGNAKFADLYEIGAFMRKRNDLDAKLAADQELQNVLGPLFPISESNVPRIEDTLAYMVELLDARLPQALERALRATDSQETLRAVLEGISAAAGALADLQIAFSRIDELRPVQNESNQKAEWPATAIPFPELGGRLEAAVAVPHEVRKLTDYLIAERAVRQRGLYPLVEAYVAARLPVTRLDDAYELALYHTILKRISKKNYSFGRSVGFEFDELRSRFRKVDQEILELQRELVQESLLSGNPPAGIAKGGASELTETSLIKHELSKQRKHLPIRALLSRARQAVQRIKPCFMMSPLSVAQFLTKDFEFDLVVMDEASQLRPEESLGAVTRARQVVVVGDPKQLPPTNFFSFTDDAYDPGEDPDTDVDQESIIDLAMRSFKARRLRWHYRSKHESLIAFSNAAFYDKDLIIFPSPYHAHPNFGVRFVRVEGIYEKRRNLIEGQKIVEAAAAFMASQPGKSLGLVATNQEQRDLIIDLMEDRSRHDAVVQDYLQKWDKSLEPFFVKNLENVQGDERDAIFISTVYGKDLNGNFFQRFGPINGAMGHRRLNVLFTRAKCQMTVFSSLDPDRLQVDHRSSAGLRALKGFLTYAKSGILDGEAEDTGRDFDSEFEKFVAQELTTRGYQVLPQVGVAGYFIDLGVRDPSNPFRFVLGIECDGATYHSAKSARDRDKTRQEVLESLGWSIHRIWSTDWFQHTNREIDRLLALLPPASATPSPRDEEVSAQEVVVRGVTAGEPPDEPRTPNPVTRLERAADGALAQILARLVPKAGKIARERLLESAAAQLGSKLDRRVRKRLNHAIREEFAAGHLVTDWDDVWKP